jgi:hypothetical protein
LNCNPPISASCIAEKGMQATTWMDVENSMLSEISQTPKDKYDST